jgi:hypothetical protein
MTKQTRLRDAAEDFVRTLEECGQSRAEAASELAAVAVSLAREGNADRASVLMEVSDSMRRNTEIEQSQGSAVGQAVEELKSD